MEKKYGDAGKYSALRAAAASRQRQRSRDNGGGNSGGSNGGGNGGISGSGGIAGSTLSHLQPQPSPPPPISRSTDAVVEEMLTGDNEPATVMTITGRSMKSPSLSLLAANQTPSVTRLLPSAASSPPVAFSSAPTTTQRDEISNASGDSGQHPHKRDEGINLASPSFSYEEVVGVQRGVAAGGVSCHNDDDSDSVRGGGEVSGRGSPVPPKTPLTMMRSVMSSIHRDRNEIEGGRHRARANDGVAVTTTTTPRLRGDDDVGMRGGNRTSSNLRPDNAAPDNDVRCDESMPPHQIPAASFNDNEEYDDGIDDVDIFENDDLYQHRCRAHPMSSTFTSPRCVRYGSEVVLRFRNAHVLTSLSLCPRGIGGGKKSVGGRDRSCFVANESHAQLGGIGRTGANRFVLVKFAAPSLPSSNAGEERRRHDAKTIEYDDDYAQQDADGDYVHGGAVLCYGDKIVLRSCAMKRVLGVQKCKHRDSMDEGLEVGCFRREGRFPQANTWTVLRGGANANVVRLGSASILSAAEHRHRRTSVRRVPIYSGDPIVLQNEWTGGLLSLGDGCEFAHSADDKEVIDDDGIIPGWSLNVIISSYQMSIDGAASTQDDEPLVEYLHRQDRCRPRKTETFQIFIADVPHCPSWVYHTAEEGSDRIYLGGSYLNFPKRHDEPGERLAMELFPELADDDGQQVAEGSQNAQSLAELPIEFQDKFLINEIIGAMMGQEGRFVRYRLPDDDEDDDFNTHEGSGDGGMLPKPKFVLAPAAVLGGKIDASIEHILSGLLPLCTDFAYVNQYVQTCLNCYESGLIARTLCDAINKLLREYLAFVDNLNYLSYEVEPQSREDDNGHRKLWLTGSMVLVEARPAIRTMAILSRVVSAVSGKKGGELLNALHRLMSLNYSGDETGNKLLQHFLAKCATPYAKMLRSWLTRGKVHDPYGEFMIEVTSKPFRENCAISSVAKLQGMEWEDWCRENNEHVLFSLLDSNEDILSMTIMGTNAGLGVDRSRATLHMSATHKAHATGKYWRAIHCCHEGDGDGERAFSTVATAQGQMETKKKYVEFEDQVLLNPLKLSRSINQAYHEASDTFLRMLLGKYDLLSSLRFMKKYFLLDQGDFFVDFLDHSEEELQNELPSVLQGRVQNWLSTSIARTSDSSHLSSCLRCSFQNKSLRDTLDDLGKRDIKRKSSKKNTRPKTLMGFEAITFELKSVPFPTSIVLSTPQLRIYQLLCRLIFFAKYAERQLVSMWSDHQLLRTMTSLRSSCNPTFSLRRRMLHFIQNLVYYLKFDVIEPAWRELESKLNATKKYCFSDRADTPNDNIQSFPHTVDDLVHEHDQFLIRIAQQCLITNFDLIDRASKIMTTCLLFSTQIKRFMETTKVHELHEKTRQERSQLRYAKKRNKEDTQETTYRASRQARVQRCADGIHRELCTPTYKHMITRFDEVFSAHLAEFMKNLNSDFGQKNNAHLANLSMQLDYNGFISSSIFRQG